MGRGLEFMQGARVEGQIQERTFRHSTCVTTAAGEQRLRTPDSGTELCLGQKLNWLHVPHLCYALGVHGDPSSIQVLYELKQDRIYIPGSWQQVPYHYHQVWYHAVLYIPYCVFCIIPYFVLTYQLFFTMKIINTVYLYRVYLLKQQIRFSDLLRTFFYIRLIRSSIKI